VIGIYEPKLDLRGILVVDNVAARPAIGGCWMAPGVTLQECARLARAMTMKNAAAGLPHGGAKSVIMADPKMPTERKEQVIRAFAHAIRDVADYIVGPDMGVNRARVGMDARRDRARRRTAAGDRRHPARRDWRYRIRSRDRG